MSKGTINEAPVYPREIVKLALLKNATSVILGHNHPSGSNKPSAADIKITKDINTALKTVDINVADHIIIYDGKYISFAEDGLI